MRYRSYPDPADDVDPQTRADVERQLYLARHALTLEDGVPTPAEPHESTPGQRNARSARPRGAAPAPAPSPVSDRVQRPSPRHRSSQPRDRDAMPHPSDATSPPDVVNSGTVVERILDVPIDRLRRCRYDVHLPRSQEDYERLVRAMVVDGRLIEPIAVRPEGAVNFEVIGDFRVVQEIRRVTGMQSVSVRVLAAPSESDVALLVIGEFFTWARPCEYERVRAVGMALEAARVDPTMTQRRIASRCGVKDALVSEYKSIDAAICPAVLRAANVDEIRDAPALRRLKRKHLRSILGHRGERDTLSVEQRAHRLRIALDPPQDPDPKKVLGGYRAFRTATGWGVEFEDRPGLTLTECVRMLRQAWEHDQPKGRTNSPHQQQTPEPKEEVC